MDDIEISFWLGVVAVLIGVIVTFIFTVIFDRYKYNRKRQDNEKTLWFAFSEELKLNMDLIIKNKKNVDLHIQKSQEEPRPLTILYNNFWNIFLMTKPELINDLELINKIRVINKNISVLNDTIRIREHFRANRRHSGNAESFFNNINKELSEQLASLEESIPLLDAEIKEIRF